MSDSGTPDLPDLDAVAASIHEARDAEKALQHVMPNAIDPDDDAYPGTTTLADDDESVREDVEEQPEDPKPGAV